MKYKLIFDIAISLLFARLKQTLVAAIGVSFSIAMFISLLSFMSGLNQLLDNMILKRTPHVRLYNEILPTENQPIKQAADFRDHYNFVSSVKPKNEKPEIYNSESIIRFLEKDERVFGVAPKITVPVFYNTGSVSLTGILNGINALSESKLFAFSEYIIKGSATDIETTPNSIIMGSGAAEKMLAQVGDVIQLTTSAGKQFSLKVVGIFQSGVNEIDNVQSYVSLRTGQKLLGESSRYITDLQIKLKDMAAAPTIAKEYASLFEIDALDIQSSNAQFETGSDVRTLISYAVGITLLIVAGFGIYNILNMMIYEKMDSIAILKATGFSGKDVNMIFIVIALSIGFFGGLFGLICGYGISAIIDQIPFSTPSAPSVKDYPIDYNYQFYMIGAIFSIITTYFAGYFPSRKASKIDPVDIIRGK